MRMLSGRKHWLKVGLALLASAHGIANQSTYAQAPGKPSSLAKTQHISPQTAGYNPMQMGSPYGMPGGQLPSMMMQDTPVSVSFEGPPPMEVAYGEGGYPGCDSAGCQECGGSGYSASSGGACSCCSGTGLLGRLGNRIGNRKGGCACGGTGCMACGQAGSLFGGRLLGLLGPLAPYSEGGRASQRWFDFYAGTIALARTSDVGGFSSNNIDPVTGQPSVDTLISTLGIAGTPVLRSSDVALDDLKFGLEILAAMQVGVGSNLEARYFGLNRWEDSATVRNIAAPNLYSTFSDFGTDPPGGFDDTDQSFIHSIRYDSELHNGEVNYRRRWVSRISGLQGSWLTGLRYFDLDERFGFAATGSFNNTFAFDQLRFANIDTRTRNQLTGVQVGGDLWLTLIPGIMVGNELKGGIYGNHAEVYTEAVTNSILQTSEFLQDGQTAFVVEYTASAVYRFTYSWAVRGSYNLLYLDNVALAPENFNTRDYSNGIGNGVFTAARAPFLNTDGEVLYQGFSVGAEFTY